MMATVRDRETNTQSRILGQVQLVQRSSLQQFNIHKEKKAIILLDS